MKNKIIIPLFLLCFLALISSENTTAQSATVTVNQDSKIPRLLDIKKSLDADGGFHDGFTIQLYYGNLNKANSILRSYRGKYGSWPGNIEYETPNYKVWVGDYSTRIEADRALLEIQRNFPSAFVLKPGK